MNIHLHRWSKWAPLDHYVDTSFGARVMSTMTIRRCGLCGRVKSRGLYGVVLPIPDAEEVQR